jgi:mono/diheme cytochrome c family protein
MKKFLFPVFTVALTIGAQTSDSRQAVTGNAENGKRAYRTYGCYECHGYAGQGSRDGPRLAAVTVPASMLVGYIRQPFGAMPAYTQKVLSDQAFADIYAYVKSLPAAKPVNQIPLLDRLQDK